MINLNGITTVKFSNMGLFFSDFEWIHPEVSVPTYEIIFVIKGVAYIEENGERYELREGDMRCLIPNKIHRGYRTSECSFYWLHFYAENYDEIGVYSAHPEDFSSAVVLFKEINHLASLQSENALIECKLLAFLLQLNKGKHLKSKIFSDIAEYIRVNADKEITASSISKRFGYNADHLSKLFAANCGLPLKKYIDRIRLDFICNLLLSTTLSVKEIAEKSGFESDNALIKFFKYHKKQTPVKYRNSIYLSHTNNK